MRLFSKELSSSHEERFPLRAATLGQALIIYKKMLRAAMEETFLQKGFVFKF